MGVKISYRFPAPQQGVAAPAPPAKVEDQELDPPTGQSINKLNEMRAAYPGMMEQIGHHYAQAVIQNMNQQGLVFGSSGSVFSGTVDSN